MPEEVFVVRTEVDNTDVKNQFGDVIGQVKKTTQSFSDGTRKIVKETQKVGKGMVRAERTITATARSVNNLKDAFRSFKAVMNGFRMEFLGLMFGFMQAQRVMLDMTKTSVNTFMKITEGTTSAGRGLLMLSAEFEYLKFVVGQAILTALEPFIPKLVQIVQTVRSFVENNKTLVGGIILLTTALATAGFVVFSFLLFLNSLSQFLQGPIMAAIVEFVGAAGLGSILTVLGWIALAVGIFVLMWKTNFGDIRDFMQATFTSIKDFISALFKDVAQSIKGLFQILVGILEGDFEKVKLGFKNLIIGLLGVLIDFAAIFQVVFSNSAKFVGNVFNDLLTSFLQLGLSMSQEFTNIIIRSINFLIERLNRVASRLGLPSLKMLAEVDYSGSKAALASFSDSMKLDYGNFSDVRSSFAESLGMASSPTGQPVESKSNSQTTNVDTVTINVNASDATDPTAFASSLFEQIKRMT